MNTELKKILDNYKTITINLIESLESNDFDKLEQLLNKRQMEIERMNNMAYTREEFTKICTELQILKFQEKLTKLMNEKRGEVRQEINKLSEVKSANKSYNKKFQVDSIFFNKKI